MNEGTGEDLMRFWAWVATKGLVKEPTAAARRSAVSEVLDALGDNASSVDVRTLDVEDALRRFENLKASKYTPNSLTTYKSRFRSAVSDYLAYLEDPSGWRPGVKERQRGPMKSGAPERPMKTPAENEAMSTSSWHVLSGARLIDYPFPIRSGVVAVLKLPTDLRESEARRLGAWLSALALPDDLPNDRPG